jgi:predicted permease
MREGSPSFAGIAAEGARTLSVHIEGQPAMNVAGSFVSGNYFDVVGTQPHLGRLLQPSDDRSDAPLAVTISHAFWTARMGAPSDVVGLTMVVGGRDAVITGVVEEGFGGLRGGDMDEEAFAVYVPLAHLRGWPGARRPDERWLNVYGRLTVPLDQERLAAELMPVANRIEASDPVTRRNARIAVTESWLTPGATMPLRALMYLLILAAPLTVLAIGCANVANLQLVRASLRTRELAVRASLGASRGQIIRLLTFEAVLLLMAAFATSALGIWILLRVAVVVVPIPVHLDSRVLLFTAAIAALVISATGLLPGLLSTRAAIVGGLRSGGRSMTSGNSRVRRGLVVAQVTLCFLLLLAAGVFTRGFFVIAGQLPANAPHTLVTELRFDVQRNYGPAERRAFLEAFDARMRADGRVRGIAYTTSGPFSNGFVRVWRSGDPPEAGKYADLVNVGGDFEVSGVRVRRGRALTKADATAAAVVNEAFIAHFQLAEPALGQSLRISVGSDANAPPRLVTIVGVASAPFSPEIDDGEGEDPTIYLPLPASPDYIAAWIRADNAALLADSVRRTIADLDPEMPAFSVRTLEDHFMEENGALAMIARTAGGLGAVALLLAVSGLYSVIAFFVALRTSEFGIRVALGARSADIVRMVLAQALRLVGSGLAVGAVLGTPLLIGLHAIFSYTQAFDPAVVLPAALALVVTALVAGWVPARRASSIEASVALRAE